MANNPLSPTAVNSASGSIGAPTATTTNAGTILQPTVYVTHPADLTVYSVTDGELEVLENSNRDGLSEAMWGFIGVGSGAAVPAFRHLYDAFLIEDLGKRIPLNGWDTFEIIYAGVFLSIGLTIFFVAKKRSKTSKEKFAEIRGKPKHQLPRP